MPYITKGRREALDINLTADMQTSGDLNYVLTSVVKEYLTVNGISYSKFNDVMGALEGAKLEFYRRVVVPYEDKKIKENGDVY